MRKVAALVAVLGGLLLTPVAGRAVCDVDPPPAACQTVHIAADVGIVSDPNGILGGTGQTLSGTMTIDTGVVDDDPSAISGVYLRAVECASIDFGQEVLEMRANSTDPDPPNGIFILNDEPSSTPGVSIDQYTAGIDETDAANLDGETAAAGFSIVMVTACAAPVFPCPPQALTSDAIPIPPPAPGAFPLGSTALQVAVLTPSGFATVQAAPTALTVVQPIACPEPGAGIAGAFAVLAVAVWRRRAGR